MKKLLLLALSAILVLSAASCTNLIEKQDTIGDYTPEATTLITSKGTFTFAEGAGDTAILVEYEGKATQNDAVKVPAVFNEREVTEIGAEAFSQLAAITSVALPSTVTKIGSYAFAGCSNLKKITWYDVKDEAKKSKDSSLPLGVESIGEFAFSECTSLAALGLGNSLETIGEFAFHDCTALTAIDLPDTTESIGSGAFMGCTSLEAFDTKHVKELGSMPFLGCTALQSIKLSDDIVELGEQVFALYDASKAEETDAIPDVTDLLDKIDMTSFSKDSAVYKYLNGDKDDETPDDAEDDTTPDTPEDTGEATTNGNSGEDSGEGSTEDTTA